MVLLDDNNKNFDDVLKQSFSEELEPTESRRAWWCVFYMNMCVMWAYYTLLSAQDVYTRLYPDADIGFYGIMLTGIFMTVGQSLTMLGGFDAKGGFDLRIQGAYVAFAAVAIFVLAVQKAGVILAAWALTGLINTSSESKLYTLAAIGSSNGELTNAVQLGNGSAGLINVVAVTVIRLCVLAALGGFAEMDSEQSDKLRDECERLSFYIFMALLIVMALSCIPVYRYLVNMPGFKRRLNAFRSAASESPEMSLGENIKHHCRVGGLIWGAALTQYVCFFMSLSVFPAIPCSVPLAGSVFSGDWYCSPGIIGSFNGGDWIGRFLCTFPITARLLNGPARLNGLGFGRAFFVFIIMLCTLGRAGQTAPALPWIVLFTMIAFAITNGVVSTLSMMRAPLMVKDKDRETAAQIMVLALYSGIASGTILAAVLGKLGLV